ncbi:hypothetical protein, partial [Actinoplanes missouriensis]|uniref:hypothetical protein n=1 Tax=Actinoplanes missouriensis TaxID=1866 RepID=UPI003F4CD835
VIAFPKTRGGFDPLTTAPTPITAQQRLEARTGGRTRWPAARTWRARRRSARGAARSSPRAGREHRPPGPG